MRNIGRGLHCSPSKKVDQKMTQLWVPMTSIFYYIIIFSFKNLDVFQKPELIIFIFGHATAILSSEIKIFQFL